MRASPSGENLNGESHNAKRTGLLLFIAYMGLRWSPLIMIPGLIALNLMSTGMWGIGFGIVNMRQKKQLKRLVATPMRRGDFLPQAGELGPINNVNFGQSRITTRYADDALTNRGDNWEKISPDLTRADPATLTGSGGPITRDETGVEGDPTARIFGSDFTPVVGLAFNYDDRDHQILMAEAPLLF